MAHVSEGRASARVNQILWAVSILIAIALTVSGLNAKNAAELSHAEAGLYRQIPGILVGLYIGSFLDSQVAVLAATTAANAVFYYFVLRVAIRLWHKTS